MGRSWCGKTLVPPLGSYTIELRVEWKQNECYGRSEKV